MQGSIIGKIKIGSVFLVDPTLLPKAQKPQEEEYTDAKILFFHPTSTDIHEKRKQVGISEGIVSFFLPFTQSEEPIQCISTLNFTHVMKEIEKDIWLNIVITHPETIYGAKIDAKEEAETIANNKFHVSLFREEDSKIFHRLLDAYYKYFQLFHGEIRELWNKYQPNFESILDDFTKNFEYHFFAKEYEKNFFWNLEFAGLFYCPIEKKQFLQTQLLVNSILMEYQQDVQHVLVFHEEFYISSTLPHEDIQTLYSYLIGCGECTRENRKQKVLTYKEAGKSTRVKGSAQAPMSTVSQSQNVNTHLFENAEQPNSDTSSQNAENQFINVSNLDLMDQDESLGISNFGKINQRSIGNMGSKNLTFIIGPQFNHEQKYAEVFAPKIYIRDTAGDGSLTPYKLLVFQGHKTLIALLFKNDYQFTYKFLESLNSFMSLHMPPISAQLDSIISKVLGKEDPIRFVYFNQMNLAIKFSNLMNKEVFTPELILTINQIHESFYNDPDCVEQHMNNSYYWVVGINSLGREIYLIFPPNYTSAKVDVEKKKILAMYFQNLFI